MMSHSNISALVLGFVVSLLSACGGQGATPSTAVNADTDTASQAAQSVVVQSANVVDIRNSEGVYVPRVRLPLVIPPESPYTGKLPDTGVTSDECYGAGSNNLISCTSAEAIALNPLQDGMIGRDVTSPAATDGKLGFSYSAVPNVAGGDYDKTECVKDNVTGLVWEGKPVGGFRASTNTYTNFDSTLKLQKLVSVDTFYSDFVFGLPTQLEIDAPNNTIGYQTAVNESALCGFTDWRLPTVDELHSLVDYANIPMAAINNDWFPNTQRMPYWSATPSSAYAKFAWFVTFWDGQVTFNDGDYYHNARYFLNAVRLVRGASSTPPSRYSYINAGAEVLDSQTNLIWRRCSEGMIWSGLTCTGTATSYNHENAFIYAKSQTGWRLPNVKELSSIIDRTAYLPSVNNSVFPGTPLYDYWSTSPFIAPDPAFQGFAWYVNFSNGYANWAFRTYNLPAVRLVRNAP